MPTSRPATSEPNRFTVTHSVDRLLNLLEAAKGHFGPSAVASLEELLAQVAQKKFGDPAALIRFHEALLFFRAFPPGPSLIAKLEKLLQTFHERVDHIRRLGVDMSAFDDFDTSGIAGTVMQDALSFDAVRWLARRIPRQIEIAWDDYLDDSQNERALASLWPRLMPLLAEDSDVEANIPWTRWLDSARGRERPLEWLLRRFEQLPAAADAAGSSDPGSEKTAPEKKFARDEQDRARGALYDSLRLPVRWRLDNLRLSRTRNWQRPRAFFYHREPLIIRSQVSLAHELSQPAPRPAKLSSADGEAVMNFVREVMAVRYRELYGTTLGDPGSVVRVSLGRGMRRQPDERRGAEDLPGRAGRQVILPEMQDVRADRVRHVRPVIDRQQGTVGRAGGPEGRQEPDLGPRLQLFLPQLHDVDAVAEHRVQEARQVALPLPGIGAQVQPGRAEPVTHVWRHPASLPCGRGGSQRGQNASAWARRLTSLPRCCAIAWMGVPGSVASAVNSQRRASASL